MTTTPDLALNFNAGPSKLPPSVLKTAQENLINYNQTGLSVLEMSHRSSTFMAIRDHAEASIRTLLNVPDDYAVLFLQGGATLQFSMVPLVFCKPGQPVAVSHTGSWTKKAIAEINKIGRADVIASSEDTQFDRIPVINTKLVAATAAYMHLCSNNTIYGTQYTNFPDSPVPLVADMSSDILSRPLAISQFHLIFAGAQKNAGPAGVTLVIAKKSWLHEHDRGNLPLLLNYAKHEQEQSLLNTAPTFSIYMLGLTAQWLLDHGGVAEIQKRNQEKAALLYDYLDASTFYSTMAQPASRSVMNVCFKSPAADLDTLFIAEATQAKLIGLKGHRLIGGLRASLYNALPYSAVESLVAFMDQFAKKHTTGHAGVL